MRDFKFICNLCRHRVQTRTVYAGELIACPVCEGEIVIPEPPAGPDEELPIAFPPGQAPPASPKPAPAPSAADAKPEPPPKSPPPAPPPPAFGSGYSFGSPSPPSSPPVEEPDVSSETPGETVGPEPSEEPAQEAPPPPFPSPTPATPPSPPTSAEPAVPDSRPEADEIAPPPPGVEAPRIRIPGPTEPAPEASEGPPHRLTRADLTPPPAPPAPPRPAPDEPEPKEAETTSSARPPLASRPTPAPPTPAPEPKPPAPVRGGPVTSGPSPAGLAAARQAKASSPFATPSKGAAPGHSPSGVGSPFARPPATTPPEEGVGRRPHTGLLFVALNALVIVLVVVVMLMPRKPELRPSRGGDLGVDRLPTVPNWNLTPPERPAPRVPTAADAAQAKEAVSGLLDALGRKDLLGAARWIIPAASVRDVTNRLSGLAEDFAGTPASAWWIEPPATNRSGGFLVITKPLDTNVTGRIELTVESASVGWRVADLTLRLGPAAGTNSPGNKLDFRPPKTP